MAEPRNLDQVHKITKAYALVCSVAKGKTEPPLENASEPPLENASKHLLPANDARVWESFGLTP